MIGRPKTPIRMLPPLQIVPRPARVARGRRGRAGGGGRQQKQRVGGRGDESRGTRQRSGRLDAGARVRADVLLLGVRLRQDRDSGPTAPARPNGGVRLHTRVRARESAPPRAPTAHTTIRLLPRGAPPPPLRPPLRCSKADRAQLSRAGGGPHAPQDPHHAGRRQAAGGEVSAGAADHVRGAERSANDAPRRAPLAPSPPPPPPAPPKLPAQTLREDRAGSGRRGREARAGRQPNRQVGACAHIRPRPPVRAHPAPARAGAQWEYLTICMPLAPSSPQIVKSLPKSQDFRSVRGIFEVKTGSEAAEAESAPRPLAKPSRRGAAAGLHRAAMVVERSVVEMVLERGETRHDVVVNGLKEIALCGKVCLCAGAGAGVGVPGRACCLVTGRRHRCAPPRSHRILTARLGGGYRASRRRYRRHTRASSRTEALMA